MRVAFHDGLEDLLGYSRNDTFELLGVNIGTLLTRISVLPSEVQ